MKGMGKCGWSGCQVLVARINPRTSKPFYYCEEHTLRVRPQKKATYYRNKEQRIGWTKDKWRRLRSTFLSMYGGKCICCHIDEEVFLSLDHVQNDGSAHRKKRGGFGIYTDATSELNPERFQILCHNCNFAKYANGICPHQLVGQENKHDK